MIALAIITVLAVYLALAFRDLLRGASARSRIGRRLRADDNWPPQKRRAF